MTRRKLLLSVLLAPFAGIVAKLKSAPPTKIPNFLWSPKEFTSTTLTSKPKIFLYSINCEKSRVMKDYIEYYENLGYEVKEEVVKD